MLFLLTLIRSSGANIISIIVITIIILNGEAGLHFPRLLYIDLLVRFVVFFPAPPPLLLDITPIDSRRR